MPLSRRARESAISEFFYKCIRTSSVPKPAGRFYRSARGLSVGALARQKFHESAQVAIQLLLFFGPIANHLLFGAHMLHQTLDRFGEVGHGGCGRLVAPGVVDGLAQAVA